MPVASGATGRVDVGVDTSTTWTPYGLKRKPRPANRNCDSYLQRYQELKQSEKKKNIILQGEQDNTDPSNHENVEAKEGSPPKNGGSEGHASGKPSSGERPKKSRLCVLL